MSYMYYNPNPEGKQTGDCVIRAVSKTENLDWDQTYINLTAKGFEMKDWGNQNEVWGAYLRSKGYKQHLIPDTCPECYRVADFAKDHPTGTYIVATGNHVVAVINGNYYDAFDSGKDIATSYWQKGVM